jgi:6-phosphofructokinase 1
MSGKRSGSVTIHRIGDYSVDYKLSPLEEIAAKTRKMPDDFIARSGTHVTEAFHRYLEPLLGTGMPQVHRLRSPAVPKLLKPG